MRFVETDKLEPGMIVGRDIVSTKNASVLRKGIQLTARYIEYLQEKGYVGVYITDSLSEEIQIQEPIEPKLFYEGMMAVSEENVDAMEKAATEIVSFITKRDEVGLDLIDLRSYDDYTYHHSVNVAVYCVVVGKKLGLSENDLKLLCQAGIAHDLGKMKIPQAILNKEGKLSDEEYACIKQHPKGSFDILSKNYGISAVVKQAVLFHHENENGTGYPLGKEGNEIPYLAKIIHVVDVYDALTSKRPYKKPYSPIAAFEYLNGGKGILFDEKVVEALISVIPAYPAGIDIMLSNGEEAIVANQTEDPLRPVIKIKSDGRNVNLYCDADYANVYITKSGTTQKDYAGKIETLNENRQAVKQIKKKVMVVDDTRMTLMVIKEALQQEYDVIALNSGIEAINYIKERGIPDLILMDIEMPITNGITAVRTIRENGYTKVPVMFMSAAKDRETILKCRELGAIDYILKPVKPVYIYERISEAFHMNRE